MADSNTTEETKVELPQETNVIVHEVEDFAIIVNVDGWRMRVYFDEGVDKDRFRFGQSVLVSYFGDITDAHTVRFEKLK